MEQQYHSVFDIIGPVMVGPSSSHTAGVVKIGLMARAIFQLPPKAVDIHLYGSFAETYQGHGTDIALVGGLLNLQPADPALRRSLLLAKKQHLIINFYPDAATKTANPNTVKLILKHPEKQMKITGVSIGGGKALITKIDQITTDISADLITIVITHQDRPGMIYQVSRVLNEAEINIATMKVRREAKGALAMMLIEVDNCEVRPISAKLKMITGINEVIVIDLKETKDDQDN